MAPGKDIQVLFNEKEKTIDKVLAENIAFFLDKLSTEHEVGNFNSPLQIDLAKNYFKERALRLQYEKINRLLDAGKVEEAIEANENNIIIESGLSDFYNPFNDEEIKSYLSEDTKGGIFRLPGAVGDLIGEFNRNNLIAFTGIEKRGKCNVAGTLVLLPNGSYKKIEDIVRDKDEKIVCLNETNYRFEESIITDWMDQGVQPAFEIKTKTGRSIGLTIEHPLLTPVGVWKKLKDLKVGDFIAVPNQLNFFGDKSMPSCKIRLLAYLIADGCFRSTAITFSKLDPETRIDFEECVNEMGDSVKWVNKNREAMIVNAPERKWKHGSKIKKFIKDCGLSNKLSRDKEMPNCIFELPKEQLAEFLNILFTCDGSIFKSGIDYCSSNKNLAFSVFRLLLRFGIVSKIRFKDNDFAGAWVVEIKDVKNILLFCKEIGFSFNKKKRMQNLIVEFEKKKQKSFLDKVPNSLGLKIKKELEKICDGKSLSPKESLGGQRWKAACFELGRGNDIMKVSLDGVGIDSPTISKHLYADVIWDKIESITPIGERQTYDLEVAQHHNFVANDIVVHNSWWLQECVFQALNNNLCVAWFSFEMNKQQTKERIYSATTAMQTEKTNDIVFPIFDCEHNQKGICSSRKRTNQINNLLAGLEPGQFPIYYNFPKYKACTECRGTRDYKAAVWFDTQKNDETLDYKNLTKKATWLKGNQNLRIKNYPSFSAGSEELRRDIKELIASGFIPDVIITDYLDIQRREQSSSEREGILKLWQQAKRLTAEYNVVHITADQANAAARTQKSLKQTNFSDDKRKDGVLDIRIGLNQTDDEKERGIMRLNVLYKRMGKSVVSKEVIVLQCLELGQVCLDSEWV